MSNPCVPLESKLLAEAGQLVGHALHGRSVQPSERLVERLKMRPGWVFLSLRAAGSKIGEWWSEGSDQWEALTAGIREAQRRIDPSVLSSNGTLALCLCHAPEVVDARSDEEWRAVNANTRRGVLGVEFTSGNSRERTSPLAMVATNCSAERILRRFVGRHDIPFELARGHVQIRTFAADQLLVVLPTPTRTIPLTRGARLVQPSEVTPSHVQELADVLGEYLVRHVHPDGRITYLYYPSREEEDVTRNNMIRQWMATLALCRLAQARSDRSISGLADRNIRHNLVHFYRNEHGCGLIDDDGMVKLGAVALAALAIAAHDRRGDYEDVEASLWQTIDQLWQPTGAFRTFYRPRGRNDMQDFYPGEALLAWAHRYRESHDPELRQRFMKSFRYYRSWHLDPKNRKPAFVPWHTQAYCLMWRETAEPELADFVFEMNDWLLPMQQWPTPEHPEFAGRFFDPKQAFGPPHASSTGVFLEGLAEAHALATELGDADHAERYRLALCRGVRSISQLTFQDDADLFYVAKRDRVRGGVRTTCYDNVIRIDNVQHALLALLKIVKGLHPGDYSCSLTALPEYATDMLPPEAPLQAAAYSVLEGANEYADRTSVCVTFCWAEDAWHPAESVARLLTMVPELRAQIGELPMGRHESSGALVARIIASTAQALQVRVGCLAEAAVGRAGREPGRFVAAVVTEYPEVGSRALALAAFIVAVASMPAPPATGFPPDRYVNAFVRFSRSFLPDAVRREIGRAARARRIPWERVSRRPDVFLLGTGLFQKRCDLTTTSHTSMVDALMTADKPVSNSRLASLGVPVPQQRLARSVEEAVEAAGKIGYPVVTKPWGGSGGHGVSANLIDGCQVRDGYARAAELRGNRVALEEHLPGEDYRLLFIDGEYVAACKKIPPHVVGDGEQTIVELVHSANRNRQRPDGLWHSLHECHIDQDSERVLRDAGYHPNTVPAAGERVFISSAANGGTTQDVTARMHPDNIAAAARAARIAGIDVCGVDFLLPDPERSYRRTGGGICEVNYQPSLLLHMIADGGRSLAVVKRLVEALVPPTRGGRVPVGILLGVQPGLAATVARLLGGHGVAHATAQAVTINGFDASADKMTWPRAGHMALLDPDARWVLLEPTPDQVLAHGLLVDWCDVAVLGDPQVEPGPVHDLVLGLASTVVLWESALAAAGRDARTEHTIVCSLDPDSASLRVHLDRGGRGVVRASGGEVYATTGRKKRSLSGVAVIPDATETNALLAAATAWGLAGGLDHLPNALHCSSAPEKEHDGKNG